jgi:hypothetical protein
MKKVFATFGFAAIVAAILAGCMSKSTAPTARTSTNPMPGGGAYSAASVARASTAGNVNGRAGEMPAFYDHQQVTINSIQKADNAAAHVAANSSHNQIFVTNDLDDPQDFDPVLDAIQGDGFNPLWEQFKITFNAGVTPHQFFSDDEVLQAAAGPHPQISLVDTGELYRCSVVGQK